jgi:hypothetical protein
MRNTLRSSLFTALRAGVGLGLAVVLIRVTLRSGGASLRTELAAAQPLRLVLAAALYGLAQVVTTVRWGLLLHVQGVDLPFRERFRLTLIGCFFNLALPGAVSGDFVKMACIARRCPEHKAECILTIVLDRIVGVLGLFVLASVLVLWHLPFLLGLGEELRWLQMAAFTVGLGSVGGVLGFLALQFREPLLRLPGLRQMVAWGAQRAPARLSALVVRLTAALDLYRRRRGTLLLALALSLLVHSCLAVNLWIVARAVGERELVLRQFFLATQVTNAVASIPITPAGFGLRDYGIRAFLDAMGATPGKSGVIPVIMTLAYVLWGLVGAVVFVWASRQRPGATAEAAGGAPPGDGRG